MAECLLVDRTDGVATITLNRPGAGNALNRALTEALVAALAEVRQTSAVRAVVLTGAAPAFCAGLDLDDFSWPAAPRHRVTELIRSIPELGKPVIAAVNGAAFTGGLEIALGCDFIIAGSGASFADTNTRIGALACTGMNAAAALRIGLVNEVVPDDRVVTYAQTLAAAVARRDPAFPGFARSANERGGSAVPPIGARKHRKNVRKSVRRRAVFGYFRPIAALGRAGSMETSMISSVAARWAEERVNDVG